MALSKILICFFFKEEKTDFSKIQNLYRSACSILRAVTLQVLSLQRRSCQNSPLYNTPFLGETDD